MAPSGRAEIFALCRRPRKLRRNKTNEDRRRELIWARVQWEKNGAANVFTLRPSRRRIASSRSQELMRDFHIDACGVTHFVEGESKVLRIPPYL
ncbi:MAG: hypothetical protein AB7P78_09635, partial [Candidatus Binatia bacterium]